jgi:hypothetical protein
VPNNEIKQENQIWRKKSEGGKEATELKTERESDHQRNECKSYFPGQ